MFTLGPYQTRGLIIFTTEDHIYNRDCSNVYRVSTLAFSQSCLNIHSLHGFLALKQSGFGGIFVQVTLGYNSVVGSYLYRIFDNR